MPRASYTIGGNRNDLLRTLYYSCGSISYVGGGWLGACYYYSFTPAIRPLRGAIERNPHLDVWNKLYSSH